MKRSIILTVFLSMVLIASISVVPVLAKPISPLSSPPGVTVPDGFIVTELASGLSSPKGIISALHQAGAGQFGHDLYVAESGADQIVKVDKNGGGASFFASSADFPVGVAFYGGSYGKYLYVGNAFSGGGIEKVDESGTTATFALAGTNIAGLDFSQGDYGNHLYAGEWNAGNIWQVDLSGNAILFSSNPGTQTRYLQFSHGNGFGIKLYYTDFATGDIYEVDSNGDATYFTTTGDTSLEGFAFSPGGAFGHYLYTGGILSGNIYQVSPDGTVTTWASGFGGVADIHFEPGEHGGFTMYLVDGKSPGHVYAISKQ